MRAVWFSVVYSSDASGAVQVVGCMHSVDTDEQGVTNAMRVVRLSPSLARARPDLLWRLEKGLWSSLVSVF